MYGYEASGLVQTREQFVDGQFAARTRSHYDPFGELWLYEEREGGSTGQSPILDFENYDAIFTYDASGALKSTCARPPGTPLGTRSSLLKLSAL